MVNSFRSSDLEVADARGRRRMSREFLVALRGAFLTQAVMAGLTALVLDGGLAHRAFWLSSVCQGAITGMIFIRRPMCPTRHDLALIRFGIVPLTIAIWFSWRLLCSAANVSPWFLRMLRLRA